MFKDKVSKEKMLMILGKTKQGAKRGLAYFKNKAPKASREMMEVASKGLDEAVKFVSKTFIDWKGEILIKKIATMGILVLVISSICVFTSLGNTPEKVVERYIVGMQNGDVDQCMDCLSPKGQAELNVALGAMGALVNVDSEYLLKSFLGYAFINLGDKYDFKIGEPEHIEESVKINVDFIQNGKVVLTCPFILEKYKGKWRING